MHCIQWAMQELLMLKTLWLRPHRRQGDVCRAAVLQYKCPRPDCQATYNTLQANQLINFTDGELHCEICNSVLDQDFGDNVVGNETLRKERNKAAKALRVCPCIPAISIPISNIM